MHGAEKEKKLQYCSPLPTQAPPGFVSESVGDPGHAAPLHDGEGAVQLRERVRVWLLPQAPLHAVQAAHADHAPSTAAEQ